MFQELMPLLANRTVVITAAKNDDKTLIVNVIPKVGKDVKDENTALTTPLSVTGTAEELDHELPGLIAGYVDELGKFKSNLDAVKENLDTALKEASEEAKKKADEAKKKSAPRTIARPAVAAPVKPELPKTDLFAGGSMPAAEPPQPAETTADPAPITEMPAAEASVPAPAAAAAKKTRTRPIRGKDAESVQIPEVPAPITTAGLDAKLAQKNDSAPAPAPVLEDKPDNFLDDEKGGADEMIHPLDQIMGRGTPTVEDEEECPF